MTQSTAREYPAMRQIDLRPVFHNGKNYYMLRDPLQLGEGTMLVPPALVGALSFLDGAHTAADVAKDLERFFGYSVQADLVQGLLQALDEACLLRNEHSEAVRRQKTQAFRQEPYRPALLAGPEDAIARGALRRQLDGFLAATQPVGARPDLVSAMAAGRFGLLSPHIDYGRGGSVYAQVWQEAAEAIHAAEVVILLGTDHQGDDPFTLTRQSYATPYGVLPTAQPVVDAVVDVLGEDEAFAGELRHRGEHSLELVAVWLHHMRQGAPVELAPILVGSLYQHIGNGSPRRRRTAASRRCWRAWQRRRAGGAWQW